MYEPEHLFRIYAPEECGPDGYPFAWHEQTLVPPDGQTALPQDGPLVDDAVKDIVRENAGNRCVRCGHPYAAGTGEWSACDEHCTHGGYVEIFRDGWWLPDDDPRNITERRAQWRVLTVHHLLTGPEGKRNLLWWNLVALCQRCHLNVQRRVHLPTPWPWPHSEWFRPYAAGWYAFAYHGEAISREEAMRRMPELLAIEESMEQLSIFGDLWR